MTSNRPEFVVTAHAVSKVGAAPVLLNSSWKAFEVGTALGLTGPRFGVADGPGAALLAQHLGGDAVLDLDDPAAAAVIDRTSSAPPLGRVGGGRRRRVRLQLRDDRPAQGGAAHARVDRPRHRALGHALGLGPGDRFQVATPPSHILGLLNLLAAAAAGATVRLHRRFDLDEELRCIEEDRMTLEMAVAPIALAMANHPDLESYDLSSLRYIMWGATPITASVAEPVTARTGVRWLPAYGTSEVPVIAANPVDRSGQVAPRFRRAPRGRCLAPRRRPRHRRRPRVRWRRRGTGQERVGHGRLPARGGHGRCVRRRVVPHG